MVHAPGRCISTVLNSLKDSIPNEASQFLNDFQIKVVKFLTEKYEELEKELQEMLPKLKELALGKDEPQEEE